MPTIPRVSMRIVDATVLILAAALFGACGGSPGPRGGLSDAGPLDAGPDDAGDIDGNVTPPLDAGDVDGNVPPLDAGIDAGAVDAGIDAGAPDGGAGGSVASPPAEVVRTGTAGLLLRGIVLTPTGVLDPGEVLVVGNAITCVAADCSATPGAAAATVIDTHGILSPGLIDSHNHLAYDFLGEWIPPMPYIDRYTWANDPSYEDFIRPYADMRSAGAVYCPCAKWGELRAIVHGTTTVLGGSAQQGCVNAFVRNPDHYDGIGNEQLATNIADPGDITDAQAATYVSRFTATSPLSRLAVHMAEGTDPTLASEFDSFAGRDPRTNRHNGTSLLSGTGYVGTAVLIHSVPLSMAQLMEAADTQSKMVWSPSSNMVLYGGTGGHRRRGSRSASRSASARIGRSPARTTCSANCASPATTRAPSGWPRSRRSASGRWRRSTAPTSSGSSRRSVGSRSARAPTSP